MRNVYANCFLVLHLCFYLNLLESWSKPGICVFCGKASWLDTELLVKVRGIQNNSALYLLCHTTSKTSYVKMIKDLLVPFI